MGYALLSPAERPVLDLEEKVRSIRGVGEDTRVMAVLISDQTNLVVAAAMVDRFICSREEYDDAKAHVKEQAKKIAGHQSDVQVNSARSRRDHPPLVSKIGSSARP